MDKVRSVITFPKNDLFVILRSCLLKVCEGDPCAAMVLAIIIRWHSWKRQTEEKRTGTIPPNDDPCLIQYHTAKDLQKELIGAHGIKKVRASIHYLAGRGLVKFTRVRVRPGDQTKHYWFCPVTCQNLIDNQTAEPPSDQTAEQPFTTAEQPIPNGRTAAAFTQSTSQSFSQSSEEEGEEEEEAGRAGDSFLGTSSEHSSPRAEPPQAGESSTAYIQCDRSTSKEVVPPASTCSPDPNTSRRPGPSPTGPSPNEKELINRRGGVEPPAQAEGPVDQPFPPDAMPTPQETPKEPERVRLCRDDYTLDFTEATTQYLRDEDPQAFSDMLEEVRAHAEERYEQLLGNITMWAMVLRPVLDDQVEWLIQHRRQMEPIDTKLKRLCTYLKRRYKAKDHNILQFDHFWALCEIELKARFNRGAKMARDRAAYTAISAVLSSNNINPSYYVKKIVEWIPDEQYIQRSPQGILSQAALTLFIDVERIKTPTC